MNKADEMISICENKLANYQKNEKEIYRRIFRPTTATIKDGGRYTTKSAPSQKSILSSPFRFSI